MHHVQGRNRKIFLRGQVIFPDFFPGVKCFFPVENFHFGRPVENFHFGRPKTNFSHSVTFPPSISNFCLPFFNFPSFFTPFPFFFLASFLLVGQQKFPVGSLGALCPPACSPLIRFKICRLLR